MPLSDEELLEDLRALAEVLGHSPIVSEYRELGGENELQYYNRFGSWVNAIAAARLETTFGGPIPRAELLAELRRVAEILGETPSTSQMRDEGRYAVDTYYKHFGSWANTIAAAGLPERTQQKVPSEELLAELKRLANEVDDPPPSTGQMNSQGKYSAWTYKNRFGSWSAAVEKAEFEPREPRSQPTNKIPRERLLAELQRVAGEIDDPPPSTVQMDQHGEYSAKLYRRRFGSWGAAVAAGLESTE